MSATLHQLQDAVAAAAVRYVTARRERTKAREAQVAYWESVWPRTDGFAEGSHPFGACPERQEYGSEGPYLDERKPVCAKCAGSEPFYRAYMAAAQEQGQAIRALQRATDIMVRWMKKNVTAEVKA